MARPAPACSEVLTWLRANLGRQAIAALTGTDFRALAAAAHILDLRTVAWEDDKELLTAFRLVVTTMQPKTRELAYHTIAYFGDWDDRPIIWDLAGLTALTHVSVCEGERR